MKKGLLFLFGILLCGVCPVKATNYWWVGGTTSAVLGGVGTLSTSLGGTGNGALITLTTADVVTFDGSDISSTAGLQTGTITFTQAAATYTIGQFLLVNNATVIYSNTSAGRNLTVGGGIAGTDFSVGSGSSFTQTGSSVATSIVTGNTAVISGTYTCGGGSNTHTFTSPDAGGITFASGSHFVPGSSGGNFGSTTANSVVFQSGSNYDQGANGANPFQLTAPASVVVFQTGSNFNLLANVAPALNGRTYANFIVNFATFNQSFTGASGCTVDNITITNDAGCNFNLTGTMNIKGNISVASGKSLTFTPASATNVSFNGTTAQSITNSGGTLTFGANANVVIANTSAAVTFATSQTISGSMTVNANATLATTGTLTLAGTPAINGSFQINQGGFATGGTWNYGTTGTLIFNNSSGSYGVNNDAYWPTTNGPVNVTVQNGGGITMNVARTVPSSGTTGTFLLVTGTNAVQGTALTLNGTVQIKGGNFQTSPTYGSSSTLIYDNSSTYTTSNEWTGGATQGVAAGSGIPANVTVQTTSLTLGGGRGVPGNITVASGGSMTLNATAGDLYIGGNLSNSGSSWINNSRAVVFVNTGTSTITAASGTQFFDYLLINKSSGSVQVTSTTNVTINTTAGDVLQFLNAGTLDLNGRTLTLNNSGGNILVNGTTGGTAKSIISSTGTGTIAITNNKTASGTASGTLSTSSAVTWLLTGGMNFGGVTTVNGILQINAGGFVTTNGPTYGSSSTLIYNTASFGRTAEWSSTSGAGYPANVQVGNGVNTTLDVVNGANSYKQISGNLTVNSGSSFVVSGLTSGSGGVGIEALGNIINDGTITLNSGTSQRLKAVNLTNGNSNSTATVNLSSTVGGDLELTGNYTDNANFNANARAVFFTGTGTQTIGGTASAPFNIDYIVVTKASGSVQLQTDLLTEGPNGGNAITLTSATDILDLNGKTFTIGKAGVASTISGSGLFKGSTSSNLVILGTGAFGTIRFDQTTNPQTNAVANLTINRTSTGSVTLGSTFNALTSATFTDGAFDVNGNTFRMAGTVSRTSGTLTVASGTTTFNGGSAQSIPSGLYTSNAAANIVIANPAGVTFNGSVAVSGNFTVNANSLFIPVSTAVISGAGTLLGASNTSSVAQVTLATGSSDFVSQYTIANRTLTNLIIEFAGAAAQGVAANTFGGLKISNSNGVTMAGNVTVNAGLNLNTGNLAINGNTLTLNGAVSRTSGNLAGGITSNLVANAAAGSLFFSSTGTNNYLKSFTIGSSGSATLGNALNIASYDGVSSEGVLTVSNGGTLTTGGFLSIKSDVNGTARVDVNTSGSTYINGDVSVERYIRQNSSKGWRLLASNTSGQSINAAWQEGQANSMNDPNPGFGTKITAGNALGFAGNLTNARAAGFDTLSAGVSLFKYNPATDALDVISNTLTTGIASEPGYFLFIRGDRSPGQFGGGSPTTSTVLRSKGSLFQGSQTTTTGAQNYALARNPFASRIDMRNITVQSNVVDAFQLWDAKLGGAFGVGGYQTFTRSGANYVIAPGGGSYGTIGSTQNFIESGAAFFIQSVSNASNNSIIIPETAKTNASSNASYRPSAGESRIAFSLYANNSGTYDIVDGGLAFFNDDYSNAVDVHDVRKNFNFNENFGVKRDNVDLVIERRKQSNINDTIFFSMGQMRQIGYRLDIEATDIDPLLTTAILEDRYTNTSTPIDMSVINSYSFTVDANAASKAADRFRLLFRQSVVVPVSFVSVKAAQSGRNISVEWKVANEVNVVRYEVERSADGRNFSSKGTVIANGAGTYSWLDENIINGYNYYRIKSVDNSGTVKYTQVVKVQVGGKAGITVSPNPVHGNTVNIQFASQEAGKYGIRITNIAGQSVYNRELMHNGGSASQSFVLPSAPAAGIYQLEIITPGNERHTEKLIISGQ